MAGPLPLEASLRGLREAAFYRVDHAPEVSTNDIAYCNAFVNQAIQQIALEHPYLFYEEFVRFATAPDIVPDPDVAGDTVTLVTESVAGVSKDNCWVFKRDIPTSTTVRAASAWPRNRTRDGTYVQITDANGYVHTNQIRTIWREDDLGGAGVHHMCFSVVRPWSVANYGKGPFTYRFFEPYIWLPDDVIELRSLRIMGEQKDLPLEILSQDQAERMGIVDFNYESEGGGIPRWAYRRGHFQLQGGKTAPTVVISGDQWLGPEPFGTFQYCYTLAWGKRDPDHMSPGRGLWNDSSTEYEVDDGDSVSVPAADQDAMWSRNRFREPLFESAPSEISAAITVTDPGSGLTSQAPLLRLPNIEYQLGFLLDGVTTGSVASDRISDGHSGIHYRIYRRRTTASTGGGYGSLGGAVSGTRIISLDSSDLMEIGDPFYLLAEKRIDSPTSNAWNDRGNIIPDFSKRLRNIHGYQGIRLHPIPDRRYEIEARVIRRPQQLILDTDVPHIHPECSNLIVDYVASLLYTRFNNPYEAQRMMALYERNSRTMAKRYADLRPLSQAVRRRPARSRGYPRAGTRWWEPNS